MNTENIFTRFNINYSRKKELIIDEIISLHHSFGANELHLSVSKKQNIDKSTVYRAISELKEKGILKEFLGEDGSKKYDYIVDDQNPHPHFECFRCAKRICLGELGFEDGVYLSRFANGHKIERINLSFSGVCRDCLEGEKNEV